jgi:hypothetical protein
MRVSVRRYIQNVVPTIRLSPCPYEIWMSWGQCLCVSARILRKCNWPNTYRKGKMFRTKVLEEGKARILCTACFSCESMVYRKLNKGDKSLYVCCLHDSGNSGYLHFNLHVTIWLHDFNIQSVRATVIHKYMLKF